MRYAAKLATTHYSRHDPANTKRSANVGTKLPHRLRRWPNIVPTLAERFVFAGDSLHTVSVYGMRHAVSGMLYAAIPPSSASCGIRMHNRMGKSTNDVNYLWHSRTSPSLCLFNYCGPSTVKKIRSEGGIRADIVFTVNSWLVVGCLVGWLVLWSGWELGSMVRVG